MRRLGPVLVLVSCVGGFVIGCSQEPAEERAATPVQVVETPQTAGALAAPDAGEPVAAAQSTPAETYDVALLEALNRAADQNYADALAWLLKAQAAQDTPEIRAQIERMKARIDQQAAAALTVDAVQTMLRAGKAEEAVQLATAGLQQFGDGPAAIPLTEAQRQADAMVALSGNVQLVRLRADGDAAVRDHNPRAASVTWGEAVRLTPDVAVQQRLDDVNATLGRYDECLRRAAALRRDPARLEDAIAALQGAQKAWDTPEVHDQIADYLLALQKRRERLAVAEFEVRGDVGLPAAGAAIADEILPAFRGRFDIVERAELAKVLGVSTDTRYLLDRDVDRENLAHAGRVRYLVVGSISPLNGITVRARLVDVRSGLIMQTARLSAPTPAALLVQLPQLANLLMMTDEQRLAYEQQCAARRVGGHTALQPISDDLSAPLPSPPDFVPLGQPLPPPIVIYAPQPPGLSTVTLADFDACLSRPPIGVTLEADNPARHRLFRLAIELGDNLFRRHRYEEARSEFQLALSLYPDRQEVRLRADRCAANVPPPAGALPLSPASPPRPRLAILNFAVNADASVVPAGFGDWAADQLAAYFAPSYEVVDRSQVCWYMARMGVSMPDLLVDATARFWLGRAIGVRFFVFGCAQQTHSFNVTTRLVDIETGSVQESASIHVQDHTEFKLRAGELAGQMRADPAQRSRLQQEARQTEQLITQARRLLADNCPDRAAELCRDALKQHSGHAGLLVVQAQAEAQLRAAQLTRLEQQDTQRRQTELKIARLKQESLVKAAQRQRAQAVAAIASLTEGQRAACQARLQQATGHIAAQPSKPQPPVKTTEPRQSVSDTGPHKPAPTSLPHESAPKPVPRVTTPSAITKPRPESVAAAQPKTTPHSAPAAKPLSPRSASPTAKPKQAEYERQMQLGKTYDGQHQLMDAIRAYQEALRLVPNDARATAALHNATFSYYMIEGRKLSTSGKYPDAARYFEAALKLKPRDPDATTALAHARAGKP